MYCSLETRISNQANLNSSTTSLHLVASCWGTDLVLAQIKTSCFFGEGIPLTIQHVLSPRQQGKSLGPATGCQGLDRLDLVELIWLKFIFRAEVAQICFLVMQTTGMKAHGRESYKWLLAHTLQQDDAFYCLHWSVLIPFFRTERSAKS